MPRILFIHPDERREVHEVQNQDTVLDCALDNNISGIIGQCGGACNCCTCHCYVDEKWLPLLSKKIQDEVDLLEYAIEPKDNSRLACQITMKPELDGIRIFIPKAQ